MLWSLVLALPLPLWKFIYFNIVKIVKNFKFLSLQRRREKGRINVKGVRLVESAQLDGDGGDPYAPDVSDSQIFIHNRLLTSVLFFFVRLQGFPFQVGYCENDNQTGSRSLPQYTLYLIASSEKERSEWIRAIRQGMCLCIWFISTSVYCYVWVSPSWNQL